MSRSQESREWGDWDEADKEWWKKEADDIYYWIAEKYPGLKFVNLVVSEEIMKKYDRENILNMLCCLCIREVRKRDGIKDIELMMDGFNKNRFFFKIKWEVDFEKQLKAKYAEMEAEGKIERRIVGSV
jgi:hypothetical protein